MAATDYHSNLSIIPDIFCYYNKALFNDGYYFQFSIFEIILLSFDFMYLA